MWICVETVSTCMRDAINLCRGNNCWSFHIKLQSFFSSHAIQFFMLCEKMCGSFMCAWNFKAFLNPKPQKPFTNNVNYGFIFRFNWVCYHSPWWASVELSHVRRLAIHSLSWWDRAERWKCFSYQSSPSRPHRYPRDRTFPSTRLAFSIQWMCHARVNIHIKKCEWKNQLNLCYGPTHIRAVCWVNSMCVETNKS